MPVFSSSTNPSLDGVDLSDPASVAQRRAALVVALPFSADAQSAAEWFFGRLGLWPWRPWELGQGEMTLAVAERLWRSGAEHAQTWHALMVLDETERPDADGR